MSAKRTKNVRLKLSKNGSLPIDIAIELELGDDGEGLPRLMMMTLMYDVGWTELTINGGTYR